MSRTTEKPKHSEGPVALIDADGILYWAGFSSDAEAKRQGVECEPLSHCLHRAKIIIEAVVREAGCGDYKLVLSSPVNYREVLYPDYKSTRDRSKRPHWYKEIKEWILKKRECVVADEGCEADDALGYLHNEIPDSVICSADKDLQTIPGTHFNWSPKNRERGVFKVSEREALLNLYGQMLTGDAVDNIPGIYKHNGQKVTKAIRDGLEECPTEEAMWEYVVGLYKGDESAANLTASLVFIQRRRGERWQVPK